MLHLLLMLRVLLRRMLGMGLRMMNMTRLTHMMRRLMLLLVMQQLLLMLVIRLSLRMSLRLRLGVSVRLSLSLSLSMRMSLSLGLGVIVLLLMLRLRLRFQRRLSSMLLNLCRLRLRHHVMLSGRHRHAWSGTSAGMRVRHALRCKSAHHLSVRSRSNSLHLSLRLDRPLPRLTRMSPRWSHRFLMGRRHRLNAHDMGRRSDW